MYHIITIYCTVLDFIQEYLFCFYFDEALALYTELIQLYIPTY